MKKSNLVLRSLGLSLLAASAFAASQNPFARSLQAREGGGVHGGGGDVVTEKRIKEIRDNLLDFIDRGGDQGLDFKGRLTIADYENGNVAKDLFAMKLVLKEGAVTVNAIQDQNRNDELGNTYVEGARKICKGVLEAKRDGLPYVICDAKAFAKMDADPVKNADLQTVQIAHEYHALAGIERNYGSDSTYWLSDQLRAHMGYEQVRRLVVGKPQKGALENFLVDRVREALAASPTVSFRTQRNLKWSNGDCDGVYVAGRGMEFSSDGKQTRLTGTIAWETFPRSVTAGFAIRKIQGDFYRVDESPNLPYTGPGQYLPGQINLTKADDFTVVYADGFRFEAKLVDAKTLVMEAAMPLDGNGVGRQLAPLAGPSAGGPQFVPYAYFLCKQP